MPRPCYQIRSNVFVLFFPPFQRVDPFVRINKQPFLTIHIYTMQVFHHVCIIYVWMTTLSFSGPGSTPNVGPIFLACVTRILIIATISYELSLNVTMPLFEFIFFFFDTTVDLCSFFSPAKNYTFFVSLCLVHYILNLKLYFVAYFKCQWRGFWCFSTKTVLLVETSNVSSLKEKLLF